MFPVVLTVSSFCQVYSFPTSVTAGSGSDIQLIPVTFTASGTLGAVIVGTQGLSGYDFAAASGGSCVTGLNYVAGQSCTVGVKFAPVAPGLRQGGITLTNGSGSVLGRVLLSALGRGPLVAWLPGLMSTAVGNGGWIYQGDGMQASNATLYLPQGLVVDAAGNLYITDTQSNRVRRVDAQTQQISTIAGNGTTGYVGDNGPATGASLNNPTGLALDGRGNLYIADSFVNAVRVVDLTTNIIRTVAGNGTPGYSGDGGQGTSAKLSGPNGLAIDAVAGVLYIADTGNNVVRKLDLTTGVISTFAGTGVAGYSGDGAAAISAQMNGPWGVAVDANGRVCIAEQNNHTVRCVTGGNIQRVAGNGQAGYAGDGGAAASAVLNYPSGLLFDVAGNLLIADSSNNRVRRINALTGLIETIAGTGGQSTAGDGGAATQAQVYGPYSMALDGFGDVFIADMFHNRIRKITTNAAKMTFADIRVGRTSPTQTITVENTGNASLTITNLETDANSSLDGSTANACANNTVLASSAQCAVGAQFAPTVVGNPVTATITVHSAATNDPAVLTLTGNSLTLDPTTTTLTSNVNPSAAGSAVIFQAQVQSSGTNVPTGTVTFKDGSSTIGSGTLVAGVATFSTSSLALGSHSITASYAGDSSNNPSVSAVLTQVVKQGANLTLVSALNPSVVKQQVTFTVTVSSAGTPTGSVTFQDGSTNLQIVALSGAGTAQFTTDALSVGTHGIRAIYGGDNNTMAATSSTLTQTVNKDTSTTTLAAAPASVKAGEPVTLSATVMNSGQVSVSGTVTFRDGSATLGTATLNASGIATLVTSALGGGSHTLTAVYAGDTNNSGSTSTALSYSVDKIATTTLLSADATVVDAGTAVRLSATVTPSQTTGGQVGGTVTFYDGATVLGTATVPGNGVAQLSVTTLTVGQHTLTASYGGSTNYNTSSSNSITVTVRQATTQVALATSGSPAVAGNVVTFTVTVTGSGGTPAGSVAVKADGTQIGLATLNGNGRATIATSTLSVGTHIITAEYAGNANNGSAVSAPLTQVIQQATTSLVLTASVNPVVSGQPVVLTATASSNGGIPSGQVQFLDGGVALGAGTLSGSGVATLQVSTLTAGVHVITVVYAGDTKYQPANSNALSLTVLQAITVAIASDNNPSIAGRAVTFTATVSGGNNLTGSVTFKDGSLTLANVALQAGVASYTTTNLAVGTHGIIASYSGDSTNAAANSGTLVQTVRTATTTVIATPNASTLIYGTPLTMQVQVTGNGGAVTGQVVLLDGTQALGTATLSNQGTANFVNSSLAIGSHSLTVSYAGDANNAAAVSGAVQVLVRQNSQVALVSSLNPALTADTVVFTAKVTNVDGKPTGSISFLDGGSLLGQAQLDPNGNASLSTSALAAGTHAITAQYSGDTLNVGSTASVSQQIVLRPTTTGLSISSASTQTGQPVTLVAVIRGTGPVTPTGVVTFTSGTSVLGSARLDANAVATFTLSPAAGNYQVVATYGGDALYAGSFSQGVNLAVAQAEQFTLALAPPSVKLATGDHSVITLTVTSINNFSDTINLGCAGLPFAATCTFSSPTVKLAANGKQVIQVTVDTGTPLGAGAQASVRREETAPVLATMLWPGAAMLGVLGLGLRKRRRMLGGLLMTLAMIGVIGTATGCGSLHVNTTPAGSYTFQVTGVGVTSGATQAANVTLTVGQ